MPCLAVQLLAVPCGSASISVAQALHLACHRQAARLGVTTACLPKSLAPLPTASLSRRALLPVRFVAAFPGGLCQWSKRRLLRGDASRHPAVFIRPLLLMPVRLGVLAGEP